MSNSLPITVRVDGETAGAACRLRELFATPAGADICAGVDSLSVDTLERIHTAVAGLYYRTEFLMGEIARSGRASVTDVGPVHEPAGLRYTFYVIDRSGAYIGGLEVQGGLRLTEADARATAAQALANQTPERWRHYDTPRLSRAAADVVTL